MGAWGEGLFSDDTALDVRGDWEALYKRFGEPVQATRELLAGWDANDPDMGPVVILALAMCQWKYGCLQADIKRRALEVVHTGAGLHLWDGPSLGKRKAVYGRIGAALERPQPPLKRVKVLTPPEPQKFKPGDLLVYRCSDGEFILLWVQGYYRYKGDRLPCCAAMDWKGSVLPSPDRIRKLKPIVSDMDKFNEEFLEKLARKHGETLPPKSPGLPWSGFAPRGISAYGFDARRVEVVAGTWQWDLSEQTRGPQIPHWIELGSSVAMDLTATLDFKRTLRPINDPREPVLPARARTRERLGRSRPLGLEIELPRGRATKHSPLWAIKRSKHEPKPGDIFVVNVMGKRWVVGRVILNDGRFAWGPADVLVYFYKQRFSSVAEIMVPMSLDLLIPPGAASEWNWSRGEFFHIANRPLEAGELPPRHVFGSSIHAYYRDEYGLPATPPAKDELVGSVGIGGLGHLLANALGIRVP